MIKNLSFICQQWCKKFGRYCFFKILILLSNTKHLVFILFKPLSLNMVSIKANFISKHMPVPEGYYKAHARTRGAKR
jgi:hypothetical protein